MVAELAAWVGWSERDVMESAWYNVPRYLTLARKKQARQMLDDLTVMQQASHGTQESLTDFVDQLREVMNGPEDPEVKKTKVLRSLAGAMSLVGQNKEASNLAAHADYLDFCRKNGIPVGQA